MKHKLDFKDAANFAVILGIILSIWSYITFSFDLEQNLVISLLNFALIFGALFYYLKSTRDKKYGGFLSFGRGVGLSVIVGALTGFITGIFTYVYLTFINPSKMDKLLQTTYNQYVEGGMSDEQAVQMMKMVENFMNPMVMAGTSILGMAFWGLIFGLIASAIVKKDPPFFDEDEVLE